MSKFKVIENNSIQLVDIRLTDANNKTRINYSSVYKGAVKNMLRDLKGKDYESAIKLGKEIVNNSHSEDFEHIFALCALITASYEIKNTEMLSEYSQKVLSFLNCEDAKTLELIATTFSGTNSHKNAKIFFDKLEELVPYDYNIKFLNSVCSYNLEDRKSAVEKISSVIKIVKKDYILSYYLKEYTSAPYHEIEYFYALPENEEKKLIQSIESKYIKNEIVCDDELVTSLEWLIYTARTKLFFKIFDKMIASKINEKFAKQVLADFLIDSFILNNTKKQIISYAVKSDIFKAFDVVINDDYISVKSISYSTLEKVNIKLASAYASAFSSLLHMAQYKQLNLLKDITNKVMQQIKNNTVSADFAENKLAKIMELLSILPVKKNQSIKNELNILKDHINTFCLNEFYIV